MWVCSSSTKIKLDLQELVVEGTKKNTQTPNQQAKNTSAKQFIVAGFFHHSILWEDDLPAVC